jgi:hypothetical protein
VSVIGTMASACLAFGIARLAGREVVRRVVPASGPAWVDRTVTQEGWRAVLLPVHPATAVQPAELRFRLDLGALGDILVGDVLSILPTDIVLIALGHGVAKARTVLYWTIADSSY